MIILLDIDKILTLNIGHFIPIISLFKIYPMGETKAPMGELLNYPKNYLTTDIESNKKNTLQIKNYKCFCIHMEYCIY